MPIEIKPFIFGVVVALVAMAAIFTFSHMILVSQCLVKSNAEQIRTDIFRCALIFMLLGICIKYILT